MWDLFKAELLRFHRWAIACAALHLLVLGFLTRAVDLAQQPLQVYRVIAGIYMLTALLLALYQVGGYRRPNLWLHLLHRPLPHWQIAAALLGAGALLLAGAVAVPILAVATWQEMITARVVDLRHWLLPLSAWLVAVCGYLAGGYCVLSGARYSACAMVFVLLLAVSSATGAAALGLQVLALVWLATLVIIAVKPDLSAPPRRPVAIIATALPLQLGVYYLLTLLCFGYDLMGATQGSHPGASKPPRGGFTEAVRAEGRDLLLAGLAQSDAAEAPLWREQVALSQVFELHPEFDALPVRGELTNLIPMEFDDGERRVRWVFSHDRMRFESYSLADGGASGVLGVGAKAAPFPTPPLSINAITSLPEGDGMLLDSGALYHYDSETIRAMPRIQLPTGEIFAAAPGMVGESVAVLSDRALYFFDGRGMLESDAVLTPRLRVQLPGMIGNLSRISLIELVDGHLLSFTFASGAQSARVVPFQQLLRVHDDGGIDGIAYRELSADVPAWRRYALWWLSPAMYLLHRTASGLFADPAPLRAIAPPPVPRSIWLLAGALSVASLLTAIWQTQRRLLSRTERLGWMAASGAIGLPAVLSLWLLYPGREQPDELPIGQAAAV